MSKKNLLAVASMALGLALSSSAFAETQITWWHGMGGALGDSVNEIANDFNASQSEFKITPVFKGTYEETLTAGIAAFRAGEQPHVMQVFGRRCGHRDRRQGAHRSPCRILLSEKRPSISTSKTTFQGVRLLLRRCHRQGLIACRSLLHRPIMYYNIEPLRRRR